MRRGGPFEPWAVGVETIVFPGLDGGAEWGGAAFDVESGLLFVNSNEMPWRANLAPSEKATSGRAIYLGTAPRATATTCVGLRRSFHHFGSAAERRTRSSPWSS